MSEPSKPNLQPVARDDIPAADPGPGVPSTAPGFGVEEEEPDAQSPDTQGKTDTPGDPVAGAPEAAQ